MAPAPQQSRRVIVCLCGLLTAALLIGGVAPVHAQGNSRAPDVDVFVEPTVRHAAEDVGALFRAATGTPVRFFSAPSSMLILEIPFTQCDLMILQGDAVMDAAIAGKAADGATRVALGRNHLVLAQRGAAAASAGVAPVTDLAQVSEIGTVAIVDLPMPDALGRLSHALLDPLNWPGPRGRVIGVATGADAAFLLHQGDAAFAVLYETDVAADPELSVRARLPDADPAPRYAAALSQSVNSPNARAFLTFLTSPAARRKLHEDGLDIAP